MEFIMEIINLLLILSVIIVTIAIIKDATTRQKLMEDHDLTLQLILNEAKNTYGKLTYKTDKEIDISQILQKIKTTPTYQMLETNSVQVYITTHTIDDTHSILIEYVCSDKYLISTNERLTHLTTELLQPLYDERITIVKLEYAESIIKEITGE